MRRRTLASAALVALGAENLRLVRLLDSPPQPQPSVDSQLAAGGWNTILDELAGAHIRAVILLSGSCSPAGAPGGLSWPPEAGPDAASIAAMPTDSWSANEAGVLAQIKAEFGGRSGLGANASEGVGAHSPTSKPSSRRSPRRWWPTPAMASPVPRSGFSSPTTTPGRDVTPWPWSVSTRPFVNPACKPWPKRPR